MTKTKVKDADLARDLNFIGSQTITVQINEQTRSRSAARTQEDRILHAAQERLKRTTGLDAEVHCGPGREGWCRAFSNWRMLS